MLQKPHTNKYSVLMKNWNIKAKIVRKKLGMKKREREEVISFGLTHPFL